MPKRFIEKEEKFEHNFGDEIIENQERIKEIEEIIATPKDEYIRSSPDGGMKIFNNFMIRLPGDPCFEANLKSKSRKTFKETWDKADAGVMAEQCPKTKDMTEKQFANAIINALIEIGADVKEVEALNKCVRESYRKLRAVEDSNIGQVTEARTRALAELYYYVAPVAVSLLKKGFTAYELFA